VRDREGDTLHEKIFPFQIFGYANSHGLFSTL
jgi:hypothetical protein